VTKRIVVLGDPVSHSLSPAIHNAAIAELGIDAVYSARHADSDQMAVAAAEMRAGQLYGANITMPHKALARDLCDRLDNSARVANAVNTWVLREGELVGHSTDSSGVLYAWQQAGLPNSGPVVVLGAGGAARAAVVALSGTHEVWVSARRPDALNDPGFSGAAGQLAWGLPMMGAVYVNATPVGMAGESLPESLLDTAVGYFEMIYAKDTPAESAMFDRGLPVGRGIDMLLGQAMASFQLWFGVPPKESVMRAALTP
jgi:shikimate dehydrogenase